MGFSQSLAVPSLIQPGTVPSFDDMNILCNLILAFTEHVIVGLPLLDLHVLLTFLTYIGLTLPMTMAEQPCNF